MKILLFGTFDRFHPGHAYVLREAMKRGDVTVVVARDANVERIKGRRPRQDERERKAAIEEQYPAVTAILGDATDYLAPVRAVQPDLILLGYDQQLPPGLTEADLNVPVERLFPHEPHKYKSSLRSATRGE
ncbi:MAG: adenylyltransferase/cytidyltransferase family protein [Candidatus Peribacteraceae bacterium]|nr:adenylyltransferase/cytidyltransferase family protein [Candidatus Peribacteraceae bacterium]